MDLSDQTIILDSTNKCRTCATLKGILYECDGVNNPDILRVIQLCADFERPFAENVFLICVNCWANIQTFLHFRQSVQDAQCFFAEARKPDQQAVATISPNEPANIALDSVVEEMESVTNKAADVSFENNRDVDASSETVGPIAVELNTELDSLLLHDLERVEGHCDVKTESECNSHASSHRNVLSNTASLIMEPYGDQGQVVRDEEIVLLLNTENNVDTCKFVDEKVKNFSEKLIMRRMIQHPSDYEKASGLNSNGFRNPHMEDAHRNIPRREIRRLMGMAKLFDCHICKEVFTKGTDIDNHLRSSHSRFECSKCNQYFTSEEYLLKHQKEHKDLRTYMCEKCGKEFDNYYHLNYHRKIHAERIHECPVCSKKFITVWHRNEHVKTHAETREFICSICGVDFTTQKMLSRHEKIQHKNSRKYKCSTCGKGFNTSSNLSKHVTVHQVEKPYACSWCSYRCKLKTVLNTHIKQVHFKMRPPRLRKRRAEPIMSNGDN